MSLPNLKETHPEIDIDGILLLTVESAQRETSISYPGYSRRSGTVLYKNVVALSITALNLVPIGNEHWIRAYRAQAW